MSIAAVIESFAFHGAVPVSQWQVSKADRALVNAQHPLAVFVTGLRKSGKSTLAATVETRLHAAGRRCYVLDDERLRQRLNRDLKQTVIGDAEAARRMGEVARLMVDAGLIVICTSSSPYSAVRRGIRDMFKDGEYLEVHLSTPLACCKSRDRDGTYDPAVRAGVSDAPGGATFFEMSEAPDLVVSAEAHSADVLASKVAELLRSRGVEC